MFFYNDIVKIEENDTNVYYIVKDYDEWSELCTIKRIFPLYARNKEITKEAHTIRLDISFNDNRRAWEAKMFTYMWLAKEENKKFHGEEEWDSEMNSGDSVKYSAICSIDECLDALNDLSILHKQFDDEEYFLKRNAVIEQLIFLRRMAEEVG